jgi:glycosyltransferase involved in cell wall biosynthesis
MDDRPLIVNATAIGRRVDGIAVYGVNLVKALWRASIDRRLTIVLNEDARRFFQASEIPSDARIRWVSASMSPSLGTRGNARRWLFANHLARQQRDAVVLGLSQIEAPIAGRRGIVTVHDMIPWLFRGAHPRQYYFYRHYLGRALRRASAVVAPSQVTRDDVCRHYGIAPARVHVIHHGSPVTVSAHAKSDVRADPYVLWIGRPDPTKNLAAVLAAFGIVERLTDVRLVMAGEGLQADVDAARLDPRAARRVTLHGAVTESQKIALLDGASVLVCPSFYEGFGLPPLEAMSRGCPVVVGRTGALPEVCGDAALYVNPGKPEEIADALLRVLTQPDLRRGLAERGRIRSGAFTWEASVRAHLAVVDRVAGLDVSERSAARSRHERMEAESLP